MRPDLKLPFREALPWICFVAMVFCFIYGSRSLLAPLLIAIETDLEAGHTQATSLLLMQGIGFSLSLLISGFTLSRIRAAHMLVFSTVGSGICFACMPLVASLNGARIGFLCFGLTVGLYLPAALTTLSSITHFRDWGKTVAIHEMAPPLSFLVIPVLAQTGLEHTTWQGVLAAQGIAMIAVGLAFLFWGRGGQSYTAPPSFKGCRELFRNPGAWAVLLLMTLSMVGEFSVYSVLQLYLVDVGGFDPATANRVLSLTRLIAPGAVILGGIVADRCNIFLDVRFSLLLHAAALGLIAVDNPAVGITGVVLQSVAIVFLFPAVFKVIALCFPPDIQPVLISLSMPAGGLISVGLVPQFLGWCGQHATFGTGFLCLAVLSLLCLPALRLLKPREQP